MGERQDWLITALFLDRRSRQGRLGREMLAIAWLIALREETEKARGGSMHFTVSFSGALGLAMMEVEIYVLCRFSKYPFTRTAAVIGKWK
jgi:hypothetical protein